MGMYRGIAFTEEIRIMKSPHKRDNHIKVKICGDVDKNLAHEIRLLIENYNKQSDKKVSYKITRCRGHRP